MPHRLPARAARWPLILPPLGRELRRWLARACRAGPGDESIEAWYRDTFRADTKEEAL
jgi:hypothetical protein